MVSGQNASRAANVPALLGVLCIVGVAGEAHACNVCGHQILISAMPWIIKVGVILAVWLVAYVTWWIRAEAHITDRKVVFTIVGHVLLGGFFLLQALGAGLSVYLMLVYLWTWGRTLGRMVKEVARREGALRGRLRRFAVPVAIHLSALAVAIPIVIVDQMRYNRMGDMERLLVHFPNGGAVNGDLAYRIGKSPDFSVEKLDPWVRSNDSTKVINAFRILMRRKNPDDLVYLRNVVLDLAYLEDALAWGQPAESTYLRLWLGALEMPKSVGSRQALAEWIDQLASRNANGGASPAPTPAP